MKKNLITLLLLSGVFSCLAGLAQSPVFTYGTDGTIVPNSKYIGPMSLDDSAGMRELTLWKTATVKTPNQKYEYTIKTYFYSTEESHMDGSYNVIQIYLGDKKLLQLENLEYWERFVGDRFVVPMPIGEDALGLVFRGHTYANDPELMTIVAVNKDKAALVFNKDAVLYGDGTGDLSEIMYGVYDGYGRFVDTGKLTGRNGMLYIQGSLQ